MQELGARILVVLSGVVIDDVAEDPRVEQRENLVDSRQHQRGRRELPVVAKVSVENAHEFLLSPEGGGGGSYPTGQGRRCLAECRMSLWELRRRLIFAR